MLEGRYTRLEPIGTHHVADLYEASTARTGRQRFTYLFEDAPTSEAELGVFVQNAASRDDPLTFAVIDRATDPRAGPPVADAHRARARRHRDRRHLLGRRAWRAPGSPPKRSTSTRATSSTTLGYRRFEWKCNDLNAPSQAAARRFGFDFEGVFRQHMIIKGQNRDTAWFALLDRDWPALKPEYRALAGARQFRRRRPATDPIALRLTEPPPSAPDASGQSSFICGPPPPPPPAVPLPRKRGRIPQTSAAVRLLPRLRGRGTMRSMVEGLRAVPEGKSIQWIDLRREGHESYARMAAPSAPTKQKETWEPPRNAAKAPSPRLRSARRTSPPKGEGCDRRR